MRLASRRSGIASASRPQTPSLRSACLQQQQTAIRGLVAAVKINCEFLAPDRWQVEGKQCSVGHGGCGAPLIREAIRLDTDLLRESLALRHSRLSPTPKGINRWIYLSDLGGVEGLHRSTNIGLFYCNLEEKECHSEGEWNKLVKPYMED